MKKTLLLLAALAIGACAASAQNSVVDSKNNPAYFGVRASLDINCPSAKPDMYNNGAGFSIGANYNAPTGLGNLYFVPGITLYYDVWGAQNSFNDYYDMEVTHTSFRNFGMAIPLQFSYHFNFAQGTTLEVFTGPELRIGFVNDMHFKGYGNDYEMNDYVGVYGDDGLYNRVDCAWKFGAALDINRYYIGVSGNIGMVNLYQECPDGMHFRMNQVQITLGYNF